MATKVYQLYNPNSKLFAQSGNRGTISYTKDGKVWNNAAAFNLYLHNMLEYSFLGWIPDNELQDEISQVQDLIVVETDLSALTQNKYQFFKYTAKLADKFSRTQFENVRDNKNCANQINYLRKIWGLKELP